MMIGNIEIAVEDTPEKFRAMAEELVPPFLELLRRRNELEREIAERGIRLMEEQKAAGTFHQSAPEDRELAEEYARRYLELIRPRCGEKILKWGGPCSWGKPAKYDHVFENPGAKVYFSMRSARKAVITTQNPQPYGYRYRFSLQPCEDGWRVSGIESAFGGSEKWSSERQL